MRAELEARPLLLLAAGLIVGLVCLRYLPTLLIPLALVSMVRGWSLRAWVVGGFLVGLILAPKSPVLVESRGFVKGDAVVLSCPKLYNDRTTAQISIGHQRLQLTCAPGVAFAQGDTLEVAGIVKPLTEASARYQAAMGVQGRLQALSLCVKRPGTFLFGWADRLRRSFLAFTHRTLPEKEAAAVDALCFNVDTSLERDDTEALRRTGTVHLISASGMHVMILAAALMGLLSLLPMRRGWQIMLLGGLLVLYVAATGLHGPTVRAAIVAFLSLSAYVVRRDADTLSSLALAAVLFLLWQPEQVFSPGFQLSFVTVGAFALYVQRKNWIWSSLVATAASTPLVAYHFGYVPLLSIPANALVAFVVAPIVVLSMLAFCLSWFMPLAQGLMLAVAPLVEWLYAAVRYCSSVGWSVLPIPEFSGYWLVLIYGCAWLYWRRREIKAP